MRNEIKFSGADYPTTYQYSGRGVTITDPRGVAALEQMSAFSDPGIVAVGSITSSRLYSAFGGLRSFSDADQRTSTFQLDGLNRTTSAAYPGGVTETFGYDGEGNLIAHTDRRNVASSMSYDNIGRSLSTTTGAINVLAVSYNDSADTETRTDALSLRTSLAYDALHRLVSLTRNDTKVKTYQYDGMDLTAESDFKANLTKYTYDGVDRVTSVLDRLNQLTSIAHSDVGGHTATITDRRGNVRVEVSDPLERLTSVTDGGQPLASYQYDGNNNVTSNSDGLGNQTQYEYDPLNRVSKIDHPGSLDTETLTRDGVGNVITYNSGFGGGVVQTFDGLDHLLTRKDGLGNLTQYQFDGEGLLTSTTDPNQHTTAYQYNDLRSMTQVTDAKSGIWQYGYDNDQNLTSVIDALSRTVSYSYDLINRLSTTTQPHNLVTTYGYDDNNNGTSVLDANGQTATVGYDTLDRAKTFSYTGTSGDGPRGYLYVYDPEGNATNVTETLSVSGQSQNRSWTMNYDARNRLSSYADPFSHSVSYQYDSANNVTTLTDAAGKQTGYSYDALNRVSKLTSGSEQIAYSWTPNSLLSTVSYPNGMQRTYSYDNANRLQSVVNLMATASLSQSGADESQEFDYGYDPKGNRTSETQKTNGNTVRTAAFAYDELDRLHTAAYTNADSSQSASYTYGYDPVGNRTSEAGKDFSGASLNLAFTYDDLNRLATETGDPAGNIIFNYDNNGNLISKVQGAQTTSYSYDVRNQLRSVTAPGGSQIAGYDYDFQRRRLGRSTASGSLTYAYDGDRVINEFSNTGTLVNRYDWGADIARG
ncbi:MAG: hypothetical protein ACREAC_17130, partial [Blastocatellia bacterium]